MHIPGSAERMSFVKGGTCSMRRRFEATAQLAGKFMNPGAGNGLDIWLDAVRSHGMSNRSIIWTEMNEDRPIRIVFTTRISELCRRSADLCCERLADSVGDQAHASNDQPYIARRSTSMVTSEPAVRRIDAYLQQKAISLPELACRCGASERTLRNFRNTKKVRRDIFHAIAKEMGTTAEDLLKYK